MIIPLSFLIGSFTILSLRKPPPFPTPYRRSCWGCHERLLRSPVAGPARRGGGPGARGGCGGKWLKSPWGCVLFLEEDGKKWQKIMEHGKELLNIVKKLFMTMWRFVLFFLLKVMMEHEFSVWRRHLQGWYFWATVTQDICIHSNL